MQHIPDIQKMDSGKDVSCLKWIIYNGMWKVCANFKTNADKLNIVVYRYQNNFYLRGNAVDPKLTD